MVRGETAPGPRNGKTGRPLNPRGSGRVCSDMKQLIAPLAALVAAALPAFADETPLVSYEVVARPAENVEIRRYETRLVAETTAEEGTGDAFRRLFRYIDGANDGGGKIAMTAPVETGPSDGETIAMTAPVETGPAQGGRVMRFFLPEGMTMETAPRPTDAQVSLRLLPPSTEAALTFSGYHFVDTALAKAPTLMEALRGAGWRPQGEPKAYLYDPPWTLPWNRRNEVVVAVAPDPQG